MKKHGSLTQRVGSHTHLASKRNSSAAKSQHQRRNVWRSLKPTISPTSFPRSVKLQWSKQFLGELRTQRGQSRLVRKANGQLPVLPQLLKWNSSRCARAGRYCPLLRSSLIGHGAYLAINWYFMCLSCILCYRPWRRFGCSLVRNNLCEHSTKVEN